MREHFRKACLGPCRTNSGDSFGAFPWARTTSRLAYFEFAQLLRGARGLELFDGPFQKERSDIAEGAMFPGSELLEFGSQPWPDSQTHGCFPYAHERTSYLQAKQLRAQHFQ